MASPLVITPIERPSPNHGPRPDDAVIDILLIHYTGLPTAAIALDRLTEPTSGVSAHYTIDEDGTVYRHVPEERRAWHAGAGGWLGGRDVNSRSIGVELVNPGHEFGYRPFPTAQTTALLALAHGILSRHPIPPAGVLAHADIAPARKQDPGELFDWRGLAACGLGVWPEPTSADDGPIRDAEVVALLTAYGYDVATVGVPLALLAFQRHFHPEWLSALPLPETVRRLRALVRCYCV